MYRTFRLLVYGSGVPIFCQLSGGNDNNPLLSSMAEGFTSLSDDSCFDVTSFHSILVISLVII
jgi:hypothetical protein